MQETTTRERNEEYKWESIVREMDVLGMLSVEEDEIGLTAKSFAQHFSPSHAPMQIHVDLNTASAAELSRFPDWIKRCCADRECRSDECY